jgi:hypothetical protein
MTFAPAVVEDEEDVQRGKLERRDREEIDGPGYVHVITQKRQSDFLHAI